MRRLLARIDRFFFAPVSATPFGMMRAAWGAAILVHFLKQWPDVTRYYSTLGQYPLWLDGAIHRTDHRFSLLVLLPHPDAVFLLYLLLLIVAACAMAGYRPRLSTIATTLLLFSFHERNPWHTTGGDTALRTIGFLLCIAPCGVSAFSAWRIRAQRAWWKARRELLPPLTMPAWPGRLLLWQLVVIYLQSLWSKLLGTMWYDGSAVEVALHHTQFSHFPGATADLLSRAGFAIAWTVMLWEAAWVLVLLPLPQKAKGPVRRTLLLTALLFHTGLSVFLRLGSFLYAMPAMLIGNLHDEDLTAMRSLANRGTTGPITVLYDGDCGLCRRSVFWLAMLDWLRRLRLVNFQNASERASHAPDIPLEQLDRALHIRLADGRTRTGFSAFRALCWHLPALLPLALLLYLPGVKAIGDRVYARVAASRSRCTHASCNA
jgi:predicted DCC family thiol-disulfide oxidoreductase YuxK